MQNGFKTSTVVCTTSLQQWCNYLHSGSKNAEIPFVRLDTPASVMIGTLGTSPFIVVPEDWHTKITPWNSRVTLDTWWCGDVIGRASDLRFTGYRFEHYHLVASVLLYDLVLAKREWCPLARKVTEGRWKVMAAYIWFMTIFVLELILICFI